MRRSNPPLLDGASSLIDCWLIVDTGSTDDTQDIIRGYFASEHLPGEIHEREWQDFATNRTQALRLARHHADYSLLIDADDVLEHEPDYASQPLVADAYRLEFRDANIRYQRPCLIGNRIAWRYEGVLHEFLTGGCGDGPGVVRCPHPAQSRRRTVRKTQPSSTMTQRCWRRRC